MFQHHEEPSSGLDSIVLDAIIENSTASIAYLDTNFTFIKVNSLYVKDSGFTKEELLGKNHFALFPDAENEALFKKVLDTGEPIQFKEKPFTFPAQPERGTTYWDWKLTPVKDEKGKIFGLVLSLIEVTEEVKTRESLKDSQAEVVGQNKILEERVAERTAELEKKIKEQELLMESFVGRELAMVEMKKKLGESKGE